MNVKRINVFIPTSQNLHRTYLYNEMLSLMNEYKFCGQFANEYIQLNSMPQKLLKILKDMKIKFRRAS